MRMLLRRAVVTTALHIVTSVTHVTPRSESYVTHNVFLVTSCTVVDFNSVTQLTQ